MESDRKDGADVNENPDEADGDGGGVASTTLFGKDRNRLFGSLPSGDPCGVAAVCVITGGAGIQRD